MDGPVQTQQLIFEANHNLVYEEYLGLTSGDKLSGSFNTKDSILTIVLDYGYGTEKFLYKTENETLILIPIEMNAYFPYKISGSGGLIWINPYFEKEEL